MIELKPIELSLDYLTKWNEQSKVFAQIYVDGKKVNDNIYRVGGIGGLNKVGYSRLLKYTEAFYEKRIMDMCGENKPKNNRHLQGNWCIINEKGEEKIVFENSLDSPYLDGGVIYSKKNSYFNIETGKLYCDADSSMSTENYLFLENKYDKDKSKRGVLKIDKKTGEFELIK